MAELSDKWAGAQYWSLRLRSPWSPPFRSLQLEHCPPCCNNLSTSSACPGSIVGPLRAGIVNYILWCPRARNRNQNYCSRCWLNPWSIFQEYGAWALGSGHLLISTDHLPTRLLAPAHLHLDEGRKCGEVKGENRFWNLVESNQTLPFTSSVTLIK